MNWQRLSGVTARVLAVLGLTVFMMPPASSIAEERVATIGVLLGGSPTSNVRNLASLRAGLRALGREDGQNIKMEPRYAMGDYRRLPELATELVESKAAVILAGNERALLAAKGTGADIPIVVVACDPLQKLLGSLARPGGNATGVSCVSADLVGKRFGLLTSILPSVKRVALLYNAEDISDLELKDGDDAGRALGIESVRFPVRSADEFAPVFERIAADNCDAVYVSFSAFTVLHARTLSQLALKYRLPLISSGPEFPEGGALISYGATLADGFNRSAYFIDRILNGASPKDLPAEEPTKFYLVVNERTAAALGIKLPDTVRVQADQVIE